MAWVRCCGGSAKKPPVVLWDSSDPSSYSSLWTGGTPNFSMNNTVTDGYQSVTKDCSLAESYNGRKLIIEGNCSRTNLSSPSYGRTTVSISGVTLSQIGSTTGAFTAEIPINTNGTSLRMFNEFNGASGANRLYGITFTKIRIE